MGGTGCARELVSVTDSDSYTKSSCNNWHYVLKYLHIAKARHN